MLGFEYSNALVKRLHARTIVRDDDHAVTETRDLVRHPHQQSLDPADIHSIGKKHVNSVFSFGCFVKFSARSLRHLSRVFAHLLCLTVVIIIAE